MNCIWKKKWIYLFGIVIFMLLTPYKVNASEISGEIEVLISANAEEMQKYKDAFEKKYPDVTVNYTTYYNYETEVKERIETGNYGDVLYVPAYWGNETFWEYLEPLGEKDELSEKYYFLENGWVHENVMYGIPSHAYLNGFVYNKEVFDKAGITQRPMTIDEFLEDMQLIREHTDAIPFYTNCSVDWALYPWLSFPYIEMTGDATYKYGNFVFEENPFTQGKNHYKVYRLLYELVATGCVENNVLECSWDEACKKLNDGEIGCIAIGSWALGQIRGAGKNGDDIAFMPFPNSVDGKQYLTAVMDFSYGVSSKSENKEAAKAYVEFMLEESGYALDNENISTYKMELYPKSIRDLGNVEVVAEIADYGENWNYLQSLSQNLNINDVSEIQSIIKAAAGIEDKSFDDIMQDWNTRWEKNRTEEMKAVSVKPQESSSLTAFLGERELQLSEVELKYVQNAATLKVGYLQNQAPFSLESDGAFKGVSYEVCEDIQEKTGLKMEYYGYRNTKELIQALKSKEIDIATNIEKQEEYQKEILYSKEYIVSANALVKDEGYIVESADTLVAAVVAGEEKDYWAGLTNIKEYESLAVGINSIQRGEADYLITNFYSANYYMRKNRNKNITIIPSTVQESIHFAFTEDTDRVLIAVINKCIYSMSESNIQLYVQQYMNTELEEVTLIQFVEANAILCISIVMIVFAVILILVIIIFQEKNRSSKKQLVEMKRYEILSKLSNEYIFDYEYATDMIHFDALFTEKFHIAENVSCKSDIVNDKVLTQLIRQIEIMKETQKSEVFQLEGDAERILWYKMLGYPVEDKDGRVIHLIGKLVDVQQEMEEKAMIQTKAETDALTKLYNREGFKNRTKEIKLPIMYAMLDLDNFKSVNDTLGHAGGDEALKFLAYNLRQCMGEEAILVRYGGDEFAIVMYQISEEEIEGRLQALVSAMNTEINYEDKKKRLSISLGAAYCNKEGVTLEQLFKQADKELYKVKMNGKNGYSLFRY